MKHRSYRLRIAVRFLIQKTQSQNHLSIRVFTMNQNLIMNTIQQAVDTLETVNVQAVKKEEDFL